MTLEQIFISTDHRYFGHHGRPAGDAVISELSSVECVEGSGLRGDRFFGYRPDYKGQVTLFSADVFAALRERFGVDDDAAARLRRNLLVGGVDLNALVGREFELQGVLFEGTEECRPCYWMDQAIAPGAEAWLRGRGGLRCRILTSGMLHASALSTSLSALSFK